MFKNINDIEMIQSVSGPMQCMELMCLAVMEECAREVEERVRKQKEEQGRKEKESVRWKELAQKFEEEKEERTKRLQQWVKEEEEKCTRKERVDRTPNAN